MKIRTFIHILIVFIVSTSCVEEYNHEIHDYENVLVVQGMITNQDGPYNIYLNRSIAIEDSPAFNYETDAVVTIFDDSGNEETLTEIYPGVYQTNKNGIKGEIGKNYILHIITADGNMYESEPVTLRKGIEIDTIYAEYNEVYSFEDNVNLKGINIISETKEWEEDQNYYLKWEFDESWETRSNWIPLENEDVSDICWQIKSNKQTLIENTTSFTSNKLKKTLTYISEKSPKPFHGYSIFVNQYSINESTYYFWKSILESNEDNGNIYDNIPFSPISTINCTSNDNIKVIGYFDACMISSKRVFFKAPVFEIEFSDINDDCFSQTIRFDLFYKFYDGWSYELYIPPSQKSVTFTSQKYCIDCMEYSTTNKKPDYWNLMNTKLQ